MVTGKGESGSNYSPLN